MQAVIQDYLKKLTTALKRGDSTEHTHRPALQSLLQTLGSDFVATNEPKRIACGAPDFIVSRGSIPVGYVEAKDVGVNLDTVEGGEQLKRYRASLRNLILTDYIEFRYFRNGELALSARLGKWQKNGVFKADAQDQKQVEQILKWFAEAEVEQIASPRELAQKMAMLARLIRDLIEKAFDDESETGELHAQYEGFKQVLIADLGPMQFADMYAQTIAYGLFAARCNFMRKGGEQFTRDVAARELPKTNPFLRKVFQQIAGHDLDERIAWAVDDLAMLLDRADIASILADFGKRTRQEDPVVHFYESFLAAYDPKLRESRGVYYTPEPVVSYIVRSIDAILKRDFELKDGLADNSKVRVKVSTGKQQDKNKDKEKQQFKEVHKVQILDPATGTGTFLYAVIEQIRATFTGNQGMWPGYVAEHLLPRIYGFELLMAPYAVAHMKLGLQLKESGYDFASDERLRVYLTNTLEEAHELTGLPLFASAIAHEAASASEVKKNAPIMVVLGNPPYSGHSANKGEWIANLLRGIDGEGRKTANYFEIDGKPLGERNPKMVNDDYVKFIRFAQHRIEQTGYGILGFITNHGYLDNPTFRGVRAALLETFGDLYLLNLHGNAKQKETALDGSRDENVFDIQQGVAIGLFVKRIAKKKPSVYVADLMGTRAAKYEWLTQNDVLSTKWKLPKITRPNAYFIDQNDQILNEFENMHSLASAMPFNNVGLITARDSLTVHHDRKGCWQAIELVNQGRISDVQDKYGLGDDTSEWKFLSAVKDINSSGPNENLLTPILYRPFDVRTTYYTGQAGGWHSRPRRELMTHVLQSENLSLLCVRQAAVEGGFSHIGVAMGQLIDNRTFYSNKGYTQVLPLFVYPSTQSDLLREENSRSVNFAENFLFDIATRVGVVTPNDVFNYIYAVLHSRGYRARYAEFLKRDFPRVPLTSDKALFATLAKLGERLIALHLMKATTKEISRFPIAGSNEVVKIEFRTTAQTELKDTTTGKKSSRKSSVEVEETLNSGRVYINADQYFDHVPTAVWNYHVGGYQVCQKWLKDRKGRQLSYDDIKHYHGIVAALTETIELQAQIDAAIPGWPLQ
jgi:predicted helicase